MGGVKLVENNVIKTSNEVFCKNCGNLISKDAVICPKCGVQAKEMELSKKQPKDKTVAILLAVFLGFWVWIYTWEKDQWKFWLGLGVTIVTLGIAGIAFQIWAIVDAASRPNEFYQYYPSLDR